MLQNYLSKAAELCRYRPEAGSAWTRTGVALTAALMATPGPVYATDAEQIVATTCAACHGANGRSVAPIFPNLAGQQRVYLKKQLNDYIDGRRKNNIMSPNVAALKPEDVDALADYFSAQSPAPKSAGAPQLLEVGTPQFLQACMASNPGGIADTGAPALATQINTVKSNAKKSGSRKSAAKKSGAKEPAIESVNTAQLIEAGKTFFKNGNIETGVPGCTGCHKEDGAGDKSYPRLIGQNPTYVAQQLADFKAGVRANDSYSLMRAVVIHMTDREIKAVAEYLAAAGQ